MKPSIEKLLSDMITYFDWTKKTEENNFLLQAQNRLGRENIIYRSLDLYGWIDPKNHNLSGFNPNKYEIFDKEIMEQEDFEEVYDEFKFLFKNLPELNELFELKEDYVVFNPSLNRSDINEIYDYIKTNDTYKLKEFQLRRRIDGK